MYFSQLYKLVGTERGHLVFTLIKSIRAETAIFGRRRGKDVEGEGQQKLSNYMCFPKEQMQLFACNKNTWQLCFPSIEKKFYLAKLYFSKKNF